MDLKLAIWNCGEFGWYSPPPFFGQPPVWVSNPDPAYAFVNWKDAAQNIDSLQGFAFFEGDTNIQLKWVAFP